MIFSIKFQQPQHFLDHYVLIEVCRLLAEVEKNCKAQKDSCYTFHMEVEHYRYKFIWDALDLKVEFNTLNLSFYALCPNFDSQDFASKYFEIHSSFSHVPHIEDY